MSQYNLRTLPSQDYAALHAGEDEEFHDSFKYPPVELANDHGTSSPEVPNGQLSTQPVKLATSMTMQMTPLR